MKPALLILTLIAFSALSIIQRLSTIEASQNTITINFISPTSAGLSDTNLNVVVAINSLYQLSTVKAKVVDREKDLTFSSCAYRTRLGECQAGWLATISLAGLERGQQTLFVTATDVFNTVSATQITFRYDQPPKIVLEELPDGAIARPGLRFKSNCVDDDPAGCRSFVAVFSAGNVVAQLPNQFDGEISFAKANGPRRRFLHSSHRFGFSGQRDLPEAIRRSQSGFDGGVKGQRSHSGRESRSRVLR